MRWLCFDSDMDSLRAECDKRTCKKAIYEMARISFLYDHRKEGEKYVFFSPYIEEEFKSEDYMDAFAGLKHALERCAVNLTKDASVIDGCCMTSAINYETNILMWRLDDR